MIRFWFVIIISLPFILLYYIQGACIECFHSPEDEQARYRLAKKVINTLRTNAFITTDVYGVENLPEESGYVMYANHQGKYDAVGIIYAHEKPCTILMDKHRSRMPILNAFMFLVRGSRLNKDDMKSQVHTIFDVAEQVKQGRRYIIFPEGGYDGNGNNVQEFMAGSFKCSTKSRTPIVPVTLVDSYKPFGVNSLKPVRTQVHFLPPIDYEEYKDFSTEQIAVLVKSKIQKKLIEIGVSAAG